MTRFRLDAGRPASHLGGGPSAFSPAVETESPAEDKRERNPYGDTLLECGDIVPWPAIQMLGRPGRVMCEGHPDHGWQDVVTIPAFREIRGRMKKCSPQSDCPDTPLPF